MSNDARPNGTIQRPHQRSIQHNWFLRFHNIRRSAPCRTLEYDVSPGYLAACATPLLAGRDVSFSDTATTPPVAIVNQEFARRLFHTENAVGRYFKNSSGVSIQIVGIAGDGKQFLPSETPRAAAYFPVSQMPTTRTSLIVRVKPDPTEAAIGDTVAS